MQTFREWLREKNESLELNENVDLSEYADVIAKMTDNNEHMEVRLLMAKLTNDKRLIEVTKSTNIIIDYAGSNIISDFTNELYNKINKIGRKKFGKENWDKYIYSNT